MDRPIIYHWREWLASLKEKWKRQGEKNDLPEEYAFESVKILCPPSLKNNVICVSPDVLVMVWQKIFISSVLISKRPFSKGPCQVCWKGERYDVGSLKQRKVRTFMSRPRQMRLQAWEKERPNSVPKDSKAMMPKTRQWRYVEVEWTEIRGKQWD